MASGPGRRVRLLVVVLVVGAVVLAGCASPKVSVTPKTAAATKMAAAPKISVLPVVSCPTVYGAGSSPHPFLPRQLPTFASAGGVRFYSNGLLTVLGPAGWTCDALVAADGGQRLDVYPPGRANLSTEEVAPGTPVVELDGDYTGHGPGALLICPLFPKSPAATFLTGGLPCPTPPAGQLHTQLTADVVTFRDPPGVRGTAAGSGGQLSSSGAAVYPQVGAKEPPGGVDVELLSCTLPKDLSGLCDQIEADFFVRYAAADRSAG